MKLIVGLGNPEAKYNGTRHNVGFRVLDQLAEECGVDWKKSAKFKALTAELPDKTALLVKPTTYYNLVGESVRAVADFYKISPEDIVIVHDDIALPLGVIRTREKGSDGGNNGIKSLNQHLGPKTRRVRIGAASELLERMDAADFVLGKFTAEEQKQLTETIIPEALMQAQKFLDDSFEPTKIST